MKKGDWIEAKSCRNTEQGNSALFFPFNAHTDVLDAIYLLTWRRIQVESAATTIQYLGLKKWERQYSAVWREFVEFQGLLKQKWFLVFLVSLEGCRLPFISYNAKNMLLLFFLLHYTKLVCKQVSPTYVYVL